MDEYNRNSNNMNQLQNDEVYPPNSFLSTAYIVKHCNKWQHVLDKSKAVSQYGDGSSNRDYPIELDYTPAVSHANSFHIPHQQSNGIVDDSEEELSDYNEMEIISVMPHPPTKNYPLPANVNSPLHQRQDEDDGMYRTEVFSNAPQQVEAFSNQRNEYVLEKQYFDKWNKIGAHHKCSEGHSRENNYIRNYKTLASVYGGSSSVISTDLNSTAAPSDLGNHHLQFNPVVRMDKMIDCVVLDETPRRHGRRVRKAHGRGSTRRSRRSSKTYKSPFKREFIADNLCSALVTTFFCCFPLGVVSLYYTFKVRKLLQKDKFEEARLSSLRSRKLSNTGIMIGITAVAACLLVLIVRDNVPYSSMEYDYYLPDYIGG